MQQMSMMPQKGGYGAPHQQMNSPPPPSNPVNYVNHWAVFIESSSVILSGNLAELQGKRIGFDGNKLIENINALAKDYERFAPLTNCVPFYSYAEMAKFAETVEKYRLQADIVFNGMGLLINPKDKELQRSREHNQTVLTLHGKVNDNAANILRDGGRHARLQEELNSNLDEDGENYIFQYMKLYPDLRVNRAPYWSWAQLASYFAPGVRYLDEVYGCYEMIAFRGVDRLITKIEGDVYHYIRKEDVLAALRNYSGQSFSDADLAFVVASLSGNKMLNDPHFPPLESLQFLTRLQRGPGGQLQHPNGQAQLRSQRMAAAIEYCPVLCHDGSCLPLCQLFNKKASKRVLRSIFGSALPPMFYFMQMAGLLTPSVLSTVATKQIVDVAPIVDSAEFRQVAEFIIPLRTQIVYQLVQALPNGLNNQVDIMWVRRYNHAAGREMPILQPPQIRLDEWSTEQNSTFCFFSSVLALAQNATSTAVYSTTDSALTAVLLKALDLLGYFTHATQTNSTEVSGPSVYSQALEKCEIPSLSEYAVLLIELIRTKTLTDKPLTTAARQNGMAPTTNNPVLFASRLLSIVPIRLASIWTGPLSADLCGFIGMARSLHRTLRSLTEVIATITYFDSAKHRNFTADEFQKYIQPRLPFGQQLMSLGGVIIQYLLENSISTTTLDKLREVFPDCLNLEEDLSSLFYFWHYAGKIISILYEDDKGGMSTVYNNYHSANLILSHAAVRILGPAFEFLHNLPMVM